MTITLNRILLAVIAALALVGTAQHLMLRTAHQDLLDAENANEVLRLSLRSNIAASKVKTKAVAKVHQAETAARKDLDNAVQSNPGWANAPVPDAVWDSLYGPASPASAP